MAANHPSNSLLHVGICGGGLGGLTTAIALRRAGVQVTVLEQAAELGDIGAGIQMTPNVSRLLIKWGVADLILKDLVEVEELNVRRFDGTKVGYTRMIPDVRKELNYPWWVVHRFHLHDALVRVASKLGASLLINSRATKIEYENQKKVTVTTALGQKHTFNFLVGADGLKSVVRQALFPEVNPKARTPNCAYRAIVPYSLILKDPIAAPLIKIPTMEVWMGDNSYIITYPISGSTEMNLVLSHHVDYPVASPEPIAISVLQEQFKNYDPRIKRVVDMITESNRWPLLITGPLESWSSKEKNVVLIGDAAHSMVNHMAQGAATSMEDGAFLGRCIAQVVAGKITLEQAVKVYETERMPKAKFKQEISFLNGAIWHMPDGPVQKKRDDAMKGELVGRREDGSPNLYGDPKMMKLVYGYDAEEHADLALERFFRGEPRIDDSDELDKETEELFRKWSVGEMEVSAKL